MASCERRGSEDALDMRYEGNSVAESLDTTEKEGKVPQGKGQQSAGRSLLSRMADVITWKRPLLTTMFFIVVNSVFWFVALSSWRIYYLLTLCLVIMITVQMVKDLALSRKRGAHLWRSMTESWEIPCQESRAEESQFTEFWMSCTLFLQEMSSFKHQNPGKFCLLICSLCTFCAVIGRYVPGVVISYIVVLGIFFWPLLSSHEFSLWVEPVLQKLDFGVGAFFQKIRENHAIITAHLTSFTQQSQNMAHIHDCIQTYPSATLCTTYEKRMLQKQVEHSEIDLSAFCPKIDLTDCKELSISDTEASEVTWTDGTFNLSEGHTPQTENSEDLDRRSDQEEVFTEGLQEFPSVDNETNGEDDELSIGLPTPPLTTIGSRPDPLEAPGVLAEGRTLELVNQMAGDVIAAVVTMAIKEQLEACTSRPVPPLLDFTEVSDSEGEDFEVLDESELEVLESELGKEAQAKARKSSGFLSKLLRRH